MRLMALGCIVASLPAALLQLPWLPVTVSEFVELQHDPAPWGTASYHEDRERRLERVESALVLYALGILALSGLGAIVGKLFRWWFELAIWIVTAATCLGIVQFQKPLIGPTTNSVYLVTMIYLPTGIAITSALAAIVVCGSQFVRKNSVV
jgi:hypothetical protein